MIATSSCNRYCPLRFFMLLQKVDDNITFFCICIWFFLDLWKKWGKHVKYAPLEEFRAHCLLFKLFKQTFSLFAICCLLSKTVCNKKNWLYSLQSHSCILLTWRHVIVKNNWATAGSIFLFITCIFECTFLHSYGKIF